MFANLWRRCANRMTRSTKSTLSYPPRRKSPKLAVEALELRAVPANLSVANIQLVNEDGDEFNSVAVGQQARVKVTFNNTQFEQALPFISKVTLGGVDQLSTALAGVGATGSFTTQRFVIKSGSQTIKVVLDSLNQIAESNPNDNTKSKSFSPVTFKSTYTAETKFSTPLGGTPNVHWYINNYVDLDRSEPGTLDYMGHTGDAETYDNHNGLDISATGGISETQYVGLPVKAAAGGVVTEAEDGKFDENTAWADGLGGGNQVTIRHGNGWVTNYYHMRKGSISVKVGDYVSAGDVLGMMASSGNSTGTHLHFEVSFNGSVVETYVSPTQYWVNPLPYDKTVSHSIEVYNKYHTTESAGVAKVRIHRDLLESDTWTYKTQSLSADAGSDFVSTEETVHFDFGQTSKFVYVPIIDDDLHEGPQKFRINFEEVGGAGGPGHYSQDWTIIDDDYILNFDGSFDGNTGALTINGATDMIDDVMTIDMDAAGKNLIVTVNNETETFPLNGWHGPVKSIKADVGDGSNLVTILKRPAGTPMTITGGDDQDVMNLNGTATGPAVVLNGGGGDDYFNVGKPITNYLDMSLNGFLGDITVNGGSGENWLNVIGNNAIDPGRNYDIESAKVSWGFGKVNFSSIDHVKLATSKGNDSVHVTASNASMEITVDTGAGNDDLTGPSALGNFWLINAKNAGTVNFNDIKFSNVENLTGGTNDDGFKFSGSGNITGNLKGGGGLDGISYQGLAGPVQVSLLTEKASLIGGKFSEIDRFTGSNSGADSFTATNANNVFEVFGDNDMLLNGTMNIWNFENYTGGNGTDTFKMTGDGAIDGKLDAKGGTDTLDYTGNSADVYVDLVGKTATDTGGFNSIESVIGGNGSDTLAGNGVAAGISLWSITGQNQGSFAGPSTNVAFSSIENLRGYSNTDWFIFSNGAGVSGKVDGQGGSDTMNYSAYTSPVNVKFGAPSTGAGQIAFVENFVGGSTSDKIVGPNQNNTWKITSKNAGQLNSAITFSSFENLAGNSGTDTYVFSNGASVDGAILDARGLPNTLDYSAYTTAVTVNLATGQATGVAGGVGGINDVIGGSAGDTLTGDNGDNVIKGNGGIDTIDGGDGDDLLMGGAQNDIIAGGIGRDILIGGVGLDNLGGGPGEDILIGGTTKYDSTSDVLKTMLNLWKQPEFDYATRIDMLKNTGVNGGLNKLNAANVVDDAAKDTLTGGPDSDWFWIMGSGSTLDTSNKDGGEIAN